MPPSLRIRQKWTARNSTRMNGRNNTWNTYHRKSVDGPTSMPAMRMNLAYLAMSGE